MGDIIKESDVRETLGTLLPFGRIDWNAATHVSGI